MHCQLGSLRVVDGKNPAVPRFIKLPCVSCGVQHNRWITADSISITAHRRHSHSSELTTVDFVAEAVPRRLFNTHAGPKHSPVFGGQTTFRQTSNHDDISVWEEEVPQNGVYGQSMPAAQRDQRARVSPACADGLAPRHPTFAPCDQIRNDVVSTNSNTEDKCMSDAQLLGSTHSADAACANGIGMCTDAAPAEEHNENGGHSRAPQHSVTSVDVQHTENIPDQPLLKLRVIWDADSVPYTSTVLAAILEEVWEAQVQSLDVFASGPTAAALCVTGSGPARPVGGVLRVDLSGLNDPSAASAATSMTAHALQVAHRHADALFVLVSSDPNVIPALTALRALGRQAAIVTAAADSSAAASAAPGPAGTPWIHLALTQTTLDTGARPPVRQPQGTTPSDSISVRLNLTQPARDNATAPAGSNSSTAAPQKQAPPNAIAVTTRSLPKPVQRLLQQPLSMLCAVLSSCLDRVSGHNVEALHKQLRDTPALCASPDFPHEILAAPSLRAALVAGFADDSTWFAAEKAAVLQTLLSSESWALFAQIGGLARKPTAARLPQHKSEAAMQMIDSRSNAATGKALLAAMLIHCEACTPTAASTCYNPQSAGTGTGANGSGPYHASERWQLLVSCLDRISDNWYGELRSHMKRELLSWVKIEHFPLVLCKCRSFRSAIIGMLASSVVPEQQKQAIAKGLLQFNSAPLFAQIGFMAKNPNASRLSRPIKANDRINENLGLQREGQQLLQRLSQT